ncbi:hypothetical protein K2173_022097 [Erythroxylum novogranatense]|uniref:Uncharacterized protein n=1 Tax=Erythroxylum novogranatense TaxID=1862640 RepID=A0AAV8TYK7_9ROSI|nr:hypothetical protein K2173_022097 [Erythroxylum novogranatense]
MLSLHCLSLYNNQTLSLPNLSLIFSTKLHPSSSVSLGLAYHVDGRVSRKTNTKESSSFSPCIVHAMETGSHKYEVDPDQAKEALKELDQQIQNLSNKQVSTPKIKASDIKLTRDESTEEEAVAQGPDSFLLNWTIALFLFTIFYNVLFNTVIKPAIDGPESGPSPAATAAFRAGTASQEMAVLPLQPMAPEINTSRMP